MEEKTCSKCGEEKSLDKFGLDGRAKDGHRGVCKDCRDQRRYNQKELFCKQIIEELFPTYEFNKIRHPSFKNPETGRLLELDLYCAELKLAIEYNGPQHDKFIKFYHKNTDDLDKQKTRDLIKEGYCDIFTIELITIPNLQKYEEIREFIVKSLDARNIKRESNNKIEKDSTRTYRHYGEENTKSSSLRPIYLGILDDIKKINFILDVMDNPVFEQDDMTLKFKGVESSIREQFIKLNEAYQNILKQDGEKK